MDCMLKLLLLLSFLCTIVKSAGKISIKPVGETNRPSILDIDYRFICVINEEDPKQITNFRWLDHHNITIDRNYRRTNPRIYTDINHFGNRLDLYINKLSEEDCGQYTCVADYGREFLQTRVVIEPYRPLDAPFEQEARIGQKYKIICRIFSSSPPMTEWTRNNEKLQNCSEYIIECDGLTINNVDESHDGEYLCELRYLESSGREQLQTRNIRLEVVDPPKIINTPEFQTFTDRKRAQVRCQATGRPTPTITWLYPRTNEEVSSETDSEPGILYINEENVRNSSEYTCKAENKAGEDVHQILLSFRSESDDTPTTSSSSQDDYFNNISIRKLSSSYVNQNEKIEKKIIDVGKKFARHFGSPKFEVSLIWGISIAKDFLKIDLGIGSVLFHDVGIMEWTDEERLYSTAIGCDSLGIAKIEVKSKTNIQICAILKVTTDTNSSNTHTTSQSIPDVVNGSICFVIGNILVSKKFPIKTDNTSANYKDELPWEMSSNRSQIKLKIDETFQTPIRNELETFFKAIEAPIQQKIINNIDLQLASQNIPLADCSKFIHDDEIPKNSNSTNVENNLYIIPSVKLETIQEVSPSIGPIVIDGLFSIDSIEFEVFDNNHVLMDPFSGQISSTSENTDFHKVGMRIKTNDLRGKLIWSENSNHTSWVTFTIEFIQFEIWKNITYQYPSRCTTKTIYGSAEYKRYHSDGTPSSTRLEMKKVDANVHLGDIRITSSKSGVGENESEFAKFALYEYLKIIITKSIRNLLGEKIRNEFESFSNCN